MIESHGYHCSSRALWKPIRYSIARTPSSAGPISSFASRAGKRATITYKGPARRERHKSREEIEFDVSDAAALTEVLDRLGYVPRFRYEKYRTKFATPGDARIHYHRRNANWRVPRVEGPPAGSTQTAARLGFSPSDT